MKKGFVKRFPLILMLSFGINDVAAAGANTLANVKTERVQAATMQPDSQYVGNVVGNLDVKITSEISATIEKVVQVGERVRQGQVLAQLDPSLYQIRVAQQQAELDRVQAVLGYARKRLANLDKLTSLQAAAMDEKDQIQRDVERYKAEYQVRLAGLNEAKRALDKTTVRAPFNGVVAERLLTQAAYVEAGSVILRLISTQDIEIRIQVPVNASRQLASGHPVRIQSQGLEVAGKIRAIVPFSSTNDHTQEIRITPDEPKFVLGDTVSVTSNAANADRGVISNVSRDALIFKESGVFVAKLTQDNVVRLVAVELLGSLGDRVNVIGPIKSGELVVVRGGEALKDGDTVRHQLQASL